MQSIIQKNKQCWVCGTEYGLHEHHVFGGVANRPLSEKYGLKVYLCAFHHNMGGTHCVHQNHELEQELKALAQERFECEHPSLNFVAIFGKNYKKVEKI